MSKGKYIRLCAMALTGIVLAGCSGKELSARGQTDGERSLEEENAGERNPEERDAKAENPEEGDGREVSSEEPDEKASVSSYPKVAKLPEDKWFYQVMYSEGCYCIFDGSHYGFMTEEGEEIAPFIYEQAAPFAEGLACVCLDGKYGFIGKEGETKLPFIYDQAASFTEGLAYFRIGDDYGFIDHEGKVVLQPDCDSVSSFQEGRAYFTIDGLYGYLDPTGRVVAEPVYEDAGYFRDGLARVMRNGRYGLIGTEGEEILPTEYDEIQMADSFIIAKKDALDADNILYLENDSQDRNSLLIKTDEGEGSGLQKVFLQNHITPRKKEYLDFLIREEQENNVNLDEVDQAPRNFSKLYRMGGELVLYFYQEPYEQLGLPTSNSGFYVFRDGKMQELAAGHECGGTAGGDYICFWYDKAESRMKPGVSEYFGGFGGYEYGGKIYELQGGEAVATASWSTVCQTSGNYDQEELLKNAKLFYDDDDNPYTRETILEADFVTEYEVNGKRTTVNRYEEIRDGYRYLNALDLYLTE